MQKRSFLTVICVLLITSAFAHELDDISLTDETEPAPPKAPSDKSPDDDTPGPDPSLGMTFEDYMGSYEGKLALDRAYEEALEKYEYYDQVPEEMSQPYIEPIEVNKIEQLYDLFKPGVLPNILVIYEDKATTEGTVSVMINNLKYYNGLADIYLLQCSWVNALLAKVGTIPELNFEGFTVCDPELVDELPQIHLGVKVFNPYAETEKEKYTVSNADYSGDPGWFSTFIRKKFPNYAEKMTTFKKFKKWLGQGKQRILTFTREDYSLKYIAGLSAHFCEDFKVRFMHEEDDVETDKRLLELFDIHEYPSFFIVQRIENKIHIEKYDGKINFPDMVKFFGSFVESDNGEEQGTLKEKMEKEGLPATIPIDAHNYEYYIFQEYHSVLLHFTDGVHNMESWDYIQYRYRGMFKFAEINCQDGFNVYVCRQVFNDPQIPSAALMKPGKEKRKKPRFIKAGDDVEMIENKISLFFDDSELFVLNDLEKAKKLVAKVIKKKKLCTMFLDDKRSVPLIFKALAYNMEMNTKFYYAFYGHPDEEFLKQFNLEYYSPPFLVTFGMTQKQIKLNQLAIKEGRKDISATFKVYEDEWHYEPMDKYIRHIVGNYAKPVRGLEEYVPSVSTIYDKKDFEEKCSGLTSLETVCILGLYDGSQPTSKVSTNFEQFEKASQQLKEKYLHYLWVDINVFKNALKYFNLKNFAESEDSFPQVVAYKPTKKQGFKGKNIWESQDVRRFIYDVIEDDWELTKFDEGVALEDRLDENFFITYYLKGYETGEAPASEEKQDL